VGQQTREPPANTLSAGRPPECRSTYPRDTQHDLLKPWSSIRSTRFLPYSKVARRRNGVLPTDVEAELTVIARDVLRGYGFEPRYLETALEREAVMAEPARDHLVAEVRSGLRVLTGVAGLVLLIACVNIGLLLLSRTIDRSAELAVRAALGAGQG